VTDQRAELFAGAYQRLGFWGLSRQHRFVVLTSSSTHPPIADAFLAAGAALGVEPVLIVIPSRQPFSDIPSLAEESLKHADFVIDLQHLTWGYTPSHDRVARDIAKRKAFYAAVGGLPEDVLHVINCPPTDALRARAERVQRVVDGASMIRVTTQLGTDLRVPRGDPQVLVSFPSPHYGQVAFAPPTGTAEGVLVFQGAVRIQAPHPQTFHVFEPFRVEIRQGRIVEIERRHGWAYYLADWFQSFDNPHAYQFAHLNIGLDERASLVQLDNMSIHFRAGGILVGFGINWTPLFGTPPVPGVVNHVDMHLVNVSYYADDKLLVADGRLTAETLGRP
jgi:hypothetical protein